jgi:hypothetical protein
MPMPPERVRPPLPIMRSKATLTLKLWPLWLYGSPSPTPPAKMPALFSSTLLVSWELLA